MRKEIGIVVFILMLLCSGCGGNENESSESGFDELSFLPGITEDVPVEVGNQAPYWAQGVRLEENLFQDLNLDGIGESDDEAYVCIYQLDDYEDKIIMIWVHLGTGETIAECFPVYGHYHFMTGKLFSEDKDAIILEVWAPGSNYGAADLFVLNISPVGADPIPTITVRLDTTTVQDVLLLGDVIFGTEIADIESLPLQGLKVYVVGPSSPEGGHPPALEKIIYWKDVEWSLLTE